MIRIPLSRWSLPGLLATGVMLAGSAAPAVAQSCTPLSVVGGEGAEVEKTVSPPSFLVTGNNWNTDFSVPSDTRFSRFIVNFVSQDGTVYDVDVNLKYSNDSVDTPYSVDSLTVMEADPVEIGVNARVGETPYQVNLRVGGIEAEGNTYRASVLGCR
ncbi:hypothetical protein XM38_048770 [Halomicronema hongdechloris C2206]|uniref:Lipoprotein n=1 Tax=Halomicronema hongdechloris C2206 TaxID=1641165 RepID=A0A1Z3HUD8_9CYAN|nr:hypothetical protein [Halomicronema hongdechloris]ASC73903.1 hypothetical protein XM38_048770 [Halomicronema hongdechloris C2206]